MGGMSICISTLIRQMQYAFTCIPVLSTLNAKLPFPTCSGVVSLSIRPVRTTLYWETIFCLELSASYTPNRSVMYLSIRPATRVGNSHRYTTFKPRILTPEYLPGAPCSRFEGSFFYLISEQLSRRSGVNVPRAVYTRQCGPN